MTLLAGLLAVLFGGLVGLVSSLVGVGGGILMVPFLYFLFAYPEFSGIFVPHGDQAAVAHATSLFVIVPTALSGLIRYQRARVVAWRISLPMAATAVVAAVAGVQVAIRLPPEILKTLFGAFLMVSGANLLRPSSREGKRGDVGALEMALVLLGGFAVGFITSLLGVGGGIVAIPILIYVMRLEMKRVAATSLGVVVFSALVAASTYAVSGWDHPGLPHGALGFIFLPVGLCLLPGAVLSARLGADINQRLDPRVLKILFAGAFFLVGLKLLMGNISAVMGMV